MGLVRPVLKYFLPSEFKSYAQMDAEFLTYLDEVRSRVGARWRLTSDARSPEDNARVGGVLTSLHIADPTIPQLARAVDFTTAAITGADRTARVREFMRFEIAAVDARDSLAIDCGVQVEIVYSKTDKHYHLGLFRDDRPDELIPGPRMIERVISLSLPPGVFHNGTRLQAKARWYASSLVRWVERTIIAPIGGWLQMGSFDLTGFPRGAHAWRSDDGGTWLAVGTTGSGTTKAYVYSNDALTEITPASGVTDGAADGTSASGYGSGAYGEGTYGDGAGTPTLFDADTWSFDNFGQYLVACLTSTGKIWYWNKDIGTDLVVATDSPPNCRAVVVTPERFIFALGSDGDARKVRWATQEGGLSTSGDWTALSTNSAGDFFLATRGRLMAGRVSRRSTLLWTDVDLHAATYIGGVLVYSFERVGENCGLFAPNAVTNLNGAAYWMSQGRFFVYDGAVRALDCDVLDYVFNELNYSQRAKIFAVSNADFDEVTWFYSSGKTVGAGSLENDRYVTYNARLGIWYYGELPRAAGVDRAVFQYPILITYGGLLYEHERGNERSLSVTAGPPRVVTYATPFLESGPIEIDEGEQLARVQKLIPDEKTLGDVQATFYVASAPTETETAYGPYSAAQPTDVRFTGRQVRVKLVEATQGNSSSWRVGVMRLGYIPSGRR